MIFHDRKKLLISKEFLLSPEAEPVRKVAESLYPAYLLDNLKNKKKIKAQAIPVLDEEFMTSTTGRWARILAEVSYSEYAMREQGIEHTVVIFGSARIKDSKKAAKGNIKEGFGQYYSQCRELAKRITKWSLEVGENKSQPFVVATGGGPAIMEAGNRGAKDAGGKSIGLNITLPMEQHPNPYITDSLNFQFHFFFTRKFHFSYRAKVLIAFPGGFGTFDELFEILTLVQTKKVTKPFLLLLYGKEFWSQVVNFKYLADIGMIDHKDLKLFKVVDSPQDALAATKKHLAQFI